jgi:hypothetical protein
VVVVVGRVVVVVGRVVVVAGGARVVVVVLVVLVVLVVVGADVVLAGAVVVVLDAVGEPSRGPHARIAATTRAMPASSEPAMRPLERVHRRMTPSSPRPSLRAPPSRQGLSSAPLL